MIAREALPEAAQRRNTSKWIEFNGEGRARHEPEQKLIRTYVDPSREAVKINLSDDGKNVRRVTE